MTKMENNAENISIILNYGSFQSLKFGQEDILVINKWDACAVYSYHRCFKLCIVLYNLIVVSLSGVD